jgi:hypothetical protein
MTEIKFDDGAIEVDAAVIGKGLGIDASAVQGLVRNGKITGRHERGEGDDAGRTRLTFYLDNRRFHIIVNESGQIIRRSAIDFGARALPASLRKAGG